MSSRSRPDIICRHGLLAKAAPGHVKHCRCVTRLDDLSLQEYTSRCTNDRRRFESSAPSAKSSKARSSCELTPTKSLTPSWTSSRRGSTHSSSLLSGSTLLDDKDEEDDGDDLVDGLKPCGWSARDSFDVTRTEYETKVGRRRRKVGGARRLLGRLLR